MVQTGTNTTLNKVLGFPVWTMAAVGVALAATVATGQHPTAEAVSDVPIRAGRARVPRTSEPIIRRRNLQPRSMLQRPA
ncbi:hypothetical protein F8B43_3942 [Methylorubrum populi]|uniref:Uncharacterized protein n=1 Tax=Methylorubrum populi TaxID=223967 RepID=A0A833N2K2_9HYPH|nr:hypothetical protein F8B43_3942 [Methylorubrum populi]